MAVAYYYIKGASSVVAVGLGASTRWPPEGSTANYLLETGGKVEVPADGCEVRFPAGRWYSVKNTAKYDNAGTAAAAVQPMFYIYGAGVDPALTYAGATTQNDLDSQVIEPTEDVVICPDSNQAKSGEWVVRFKPAAAATGGITLVIRPNAPYR